MKSTVGIKHFLLLLLVGGLLSLCSIARGMGICNVEDIYQLGDSTSHTGNFIRLIGPNAMGSYAERFPYSETIGRSTSHYCDAFLIVDSILYLTFDFLLRGFFVFGFQCFSKCSKGFRSFTLESDRINE